MKHVPSVLVARVGPAPATSAGKDRDSFSPIKSQDFRLILGCHHYHDSYPRLIPAWCKLNSGRIDISQTTLEFQMHLDIRTTCSDKQEESCLNACSLPPACKAALSKSSRLRGLYIWTNIHHYGAMDTSVQESRILVSTVTEHGSGKMDHKV